MTKGSVDMEMPEHVKSALQIAFLNKNIDEIIKINKHWYQYYYTKLS